MLIFVSITLGVIIIILGVLLAISPGKPRTFINENGRMLLDSISEKTHVDINDAKQGMFIKGIDIGNPVLLAMLRYHQKVPRWVLIIGVSIAQIVILTRFFPNAYLLNGLRCSYYSATLHCLALRRKGFRTKRQAY